ncbi:MAG TPA: amidohydrolase family protein [Candidatus Acidoferrales bacterium]|nr:amidohydrolase family protein [Candidatus Acidoferrales bacterium]
MPTNIIDIHAHVYPEGCFTTVLKDRADFKLVENPRGQSLLFHDSHVMSMPKDGADLNSRIRSMNEAGIGAAVLSVGALNLGWAGSRDASAARFVNDGLASICLEHPTRFRFAAVLPCRNGSEMIKELDRVLGMGAAGVGVTTNIGDLQLDAPELREFWREMSRRKLMVLVHPTFPCDGPLNDSGTFLAIGYPGETAMAATKLALSGVLEECPDAKIVWSHLGGSLPMILDRIDRGYQRFSNCPHPPSTYLRRCYFDTACCHGPALDCARATWGGNALVFGTDVPHVPNAEKDNIAALKARSWPTSEVDDILGGTARKLME